MTNMLTLEERAYRRGCLQALQFVDASPSIKIGCWGEWIQALIQGRDSLDMKYLGKYLDEIYNDVLATRQASIEHAKNFGHVWCDHKCIYCDIGMAYQKRPLEICLVRERGAR